MHKLSKMATIATEYNAEGRVSRQAMGNNLTRELEYDLRGWLRKSTAKLPAVPPGCRFCMVD